ncbi:MAG: hypothetical protein H0X71_11350 [Rubrobacter sp.]|nr:hypothetical protein [Rubrobacter sp.]
MPRLSPEENIPGLGGATVGDFWAWAYSDILTNIRRGMFAEFLVGSALGVIDSVPPAGWEDFDLLYGDKKIEVKSSAYIQSWDQQGRLSVISFDIRERGIWDETINDWLPERKGRSADCYVFCLYSEKKDRSVASMLDMSKWDFYVVPTRRIDEALGAQKTVRLSGVESMTNAVKIEHLKERVDLTVQENQTKAEGQS